MPARLRTTSSLKEKFQKQVGSVTEESKKATVVKVDHDEIAEKASPLSKAFSKAIGKETPEPKKPVREDFDPDERLDGEEDGPEVIPPYLREGEKKSATKEGKGDKAPVVEEREPREPKEGEEEHEAPPADKKKKQVLSDAEVEGIDESTLTDKQGRPPSREAWQTVKLLKDKIAAMKTDHEAAVKELSAKVVKVDETEEFKTVKQQHEELKKKFDDRYFEESDDFKNLFVVPFETKEAEVAEWITSAKIVKGSPEHAELSAAVTQLQAAMHANKKTDYFIAASEIAELLPRGADQQFMISVTEMFPAYQKKQEAFKDKEATRKKVSEADLSQVELASKTIEKTMDELFGSFEAENRELLDFYRSDKVKDLMQYDTIIASGKKEVKQLIREFVATRKPTEKLVRVLTDAVVKPLKDREVNALRAALKEQSTMIENMKAELEKKKSTIKKFSGIPSRPSSSDDGESKDEKPSATPLTDRFRKMQMQ